MSIYLSDYPAYFSILFHYCFGSIVTLCKANIFKISLYPSQFSAQVITLGLLKVILKTFSVLFLSDFIICDIKYSTDQALSVHLNPAHGFLYSLSTPCQVCGFVFSSLVKIHSQKLDLDALQEGTHPLNIFPLNYSACDLQAASSSSTVSLWFGREKVMPATP